MMRSLFDAPAISVGELCRQIRHALRDRFPSPVRVRGEISNCRVSGGNVYFSLKDGEGYINCVCFRDTAAGLALGFPLDDGVAVEAAGHVGIYEKNSVYQLRVTDIVLVGRGALYAEYERLKVKLGREGLFDVARKRPIPRFIRDVAIVTSRDAAVLQDFKVTCRRRGAHVRIWVQHAPVQGSQAAPALARAIRAAGRLAVDVVVVARGGGSPEDLWAFNTEEVARAIAQCARPVISAVGHETDVTIADFVADMRAATPTAAAEFVAQERDLLLERIARARARLGKALARVVSAPRLTLRRAQRDLQRAAMGAVSAKAQRLDDLRAALGRGDPRRRVGAWRDRSQSAQARLRVLGLRIALPGARRIAHAGTLLRAGFERSLRARATKFGVADVRLQTLGPRQTLQRGYAIAYDARGGVLTDSAATRIGEKIGVELKTGWLGARVEEKKDEDGKGSRKTD
jgi:exodeoxyribonuclease VII large subunit